MSAPRRRRTPTTSAVGTSLRLIRFLSSAPAFSSSPFVSSSSESESESELPSATVCAPSAGTHRLRGSRRTATPSPSSALFRNVLEGTRTSPNVSKVLSFPSSVASVRSSSSPTLTVASSGLHRHTLIVPRISSPDSNPPTIASLSQCGAKARALFPPSPASKPKPKSFRSSSAFIAASFASLTDSNAFMTSTSFEWNRGKYSCAARTSTPGGRRLRISLARLAF